MATIKVLNMSGAEVGEIELNDNVFGVEYKESLIHQAVVTRLANERQGDVNSKTSTLISLVAFSYLVPVMAPSKRTMSLKKPLIEFAKGVIQTVTRQSANTAAIAKVLFVVILGLLIVRSSIFLISSFKSKGGCMTLFVVSACFLNLFSYSDILILHLLPKVILIR